MKIRCLKCNDIIESKHVHDLQKCKCGACFIDGGDKYTRIGGDLKYINFVHEDGTESSCLKDAEKWNNYHFFWRYSGKIAKNIDFTGVSCYNKDVGINTMYILGGINMIETTRLPEELLTGVGEVHYPFGPRVEKSTIKGIDEIQYLYVSPWTSIKMHGHDNQWEVWVRLSHKTAYVCLQGEDHELVNNTGAMMILMAIKGHINYSYDDLAELFYRWGFSVTHGSLVVND